MWKEWACLLRSLGVLFLTGGFISGLSAQETEPNQPCSVAQYFGGGTPYTVDGALSPLFDVDFFTFEITSGVPLRIDLEGQSTGMGTLGDPFLGLFDMDCNLVTMDDDSGTGLNSRLFVLEPTGSQITIGVTSCCDSAFEGGAPGSYYLTVSRFETIGSISGRVVDDEGLPLPGNDTPYSSVYLLRCELYGCEWTGIGGYTDESGTFSLSGELLEPGSYALEASAIGYRAVTTDPFEVGPGDHFEYGDIAIAPIRLIGSISGRLVDSVSGEPLSGSGVYFPLIELWRCEDSDTCYMITMVYPDEEGNFSFASFLWYLIEVGQFKVRASAFQYSTAESAVFAVGEGEDFDMGDLPLVPFPIQTWLVQACPNLPSQGGTCRFTVGVRNASAKKAAGQVWGMVWAGLTSGYTTFQIGKNGTTNPMPQKYNLRPGTSTLVQFELRVPGSIPDYSPVCASTLVGKDPDPLFNTVGETPSLCVWKGVDGYTVTSEKETRRLFQELRKQGRH